MVCQVRKLRLRIYHRHKAHIIIYSFARYSLRFLVFCPFLFFFALVFYGVVGFSYFNYLFVFLFIFFFFLLISLAYTRYTRVRPGIACLLKEPSQHTLYRSEHFVRSRMHILKCIYICTCRQIEKSRERIICVTYIYNSR